MNISLKIDKERGPVEYRDSTAIYPLGAPFGLQAHFTNNDTRSIDIEDPATSQKLLLRVKPVIGDKEETVVEINPGVIDITGERTAPISKTLHLDPGESVMISIDFCNLCYDECLTPGKYIAKIEFLDFFSPPFNFIIEFREESVERLLRIALDEKWDMWGREEALTWLRKLPKNPDIKFSNKEETSVQKKFRTQRNMKEAELFLKWWNSQKNTDEMKQFFLQFKMK